MTNANSTTPVSDQTLALTAPWIDGPREAKSKVGDAFDFNTHITALQAEDENIRFQWDFDGRTGTIEIQGIQRQNGKIYLWNTVVEEVEFQNSEDDLDNWYDFPFIGKDFVPVFTDQIAAIAEEQLDIEDQEVRAARYRALAAQGKMK